MSNQSGMEILHNISKELLTSTDHDWFLEYGKTIHHLKTIRCNFPLKEEMLLIETKGTQFAFGILQLDNIRTQYYPNGRITDFTDLSPTRPTYIADIFLYTRRPYIYVPKSLDHRHLK